MSAFCGSRMMIHVRETRKRRSFMFLLCTPRTVGVAVFESRGKRSLQFRYIRKIRVLLEIAAKKVELVVLTLDQLKTESRYPLYCSLKMFSKVCRVYVYRGNPFIYTNWRNYPELSLLLIQRITLLCDTFSKNGTRALV